VVGLEWYPCCRLQPGMQEHVLLHTRQSRKSPRPLDTLAWLGLAWKSNHSSYLPVYEDGTDRLFRKVGI